MTMLLNMQDEALSDRAQQAAGNFAFTKERRFNRDSESIADFNNYFSLAQLFYRCWQSSCQQSS